MMRMVTIDTLPSLQISVSGPLLNFLFAPPGLPRETISETPLAWIAAYSDSPAASRASFRF